MRSYSEKKGYSKVLIFGAMLKKSTSQIENMKKYPKWRRHQSNISEALKVSWFYI